LCGWCKAPTGGAPSAIPVMEGTSLAGDRVLLTSADFPLASLLRGVKEE
jgi:hypothetical protein